MLEQNNNNNNYNNMFPSIVPEVSTSDSDERETISLTDDNDGTYKAKPWSVYFQGKMWRAVFTISCLSGILRKTSTYLKEHSFGLTPLYSFLFQRWKVSSYWEEMQQQTLLAEHICEFSYQDFLVIVIKINLPLLEKKGNNNSSWHLNKLGLVGWWQLSVDHS